MGNEKESNYLFFNEGEFAEFKERVEKQNEKYKQQIIYRKLVQDLIIEKRFKEAIDILVFISRKELITNELFNFLMSKVETKRVITKSYGRKTGF